MPSAIRVLFCNMLVQCALADPLALCGAHEDAMKEDFQHRRNGAPNYTNEEILKKIIVSYRISSFKQQKN